MNCRSGVPDPERGTTRLKVSGTPIAASGLWNVNHALDDDATLVTHNRPEFKRVAGLRVEARVAGADV